MSRYQRFDRCCESRVYQEVKDACVDDLTSRGFFAYADVLDRTGHYVVGDAIRWDYVQRMIEEEYSTELIPLSAGYFKRHKREEEALIPGHFIARNRSRSCGMAIASRENGHLVKHVLRNKTNAARGLAEAAQRTLAIGVAAGIPDMAPAQIEGPDTQ